MLLLLLLLQLRLLLLLLLPPAADIFGLLDGGVGCLIVMLELQVWHQADHVFSLLFHIAGLHIKFGDASTAGVVIRANSMATDIWGVKVSSDICASTVDAVSMFSQRQIPGTQDCNI